MGEAVCSSGCDIQGDDEKLNHHANPNTVFGDGKSRLGTSRVHSFPQKEIKKKGKGGRNPFLPSSRE